MKKKIVLNSFISIGTVSEFLEEIITLVQNKIPSYVCFANVHMVMEGYQNPAFQKIINHADIAAPDGKPVSVFLNYFEKIKQERVCGMDFMPLLLKQAEKLNQSVYFYGSTDAVLNTLIKKARKDFPKLKICGSYSPPFRIITEAENSSIVEMVKKASPDLVFVSLGCPKQEKWMSMNKLEIGACLLGVGQAFKTYAGIEKRLPKWMHSFSLEWLYRLYLEPKRLWKRYLLTNTYFIFLTFNHMIVNLLAPYVKGTVPAAEKIKPAL